MSQKLCFLFISCYFQAAKSQFGFSQEQIELYELFYELKPTTFYQFLDIEPDATKRQIKSAYRKKAIIWHPDKVDKNDVKPEDIKGPYKGLSVDDFIEHRFRQTTKFQKFYRTRS